MAVGAIWNQKRFLKLFIFSVIIGCVSIFFFYWCARKQVISTTTNRHRKIYVAYLQAVEQGKSTSTKPQSGKSTSPFWSALYEVRKIYPQFQLNILLEGSARELGDQSILESMRSHSTLSNENGGWAKSYFRLPTKNVAALQAVSFIHEELKSWQRVSIIFGLYLSFVFMLFGGIWIRTLGANQSNVAVTKKIKEIGLVLIEIENVMASISKSIQACESTSNLEELMAQIRFLAVNGSIEASRTPESYRIFHAMMEEICGLADQSRELLKKSKIDLAINEIKADLSKMERVLSGDLDDPRADSSKSSSEKSSRRVG